MKNIGSTLATVWRIAAPYFRSEDRWAGRALLAAVIAAELAIVAITVLLNQWNSRFYNALQERNWDTFVSEITYFCVLAAIYTVIAVYQLYLNQWLQIRWRQWMTSALSRRMAASGQSLPDAASGRRRRQPRPAHDRRRQAVRRTDAQYRRRPAEFGRYAGFLRRHPVGTFQRRAAAPVRTGFRDSRAIWSGAR